MKPVVLGAIAMAGVLQLLRPLPAQAYRPFDGTDAGVAAVRRLEVEFAPLEYARVGSERHLVSPALGLTYGAGLGYEVGVQARRLMLLSPDADGAEPKIEDVELTVGKVLKEGSIQDMEGLSVAAEGACLMPGSGLNRFGAGLALVVSRSWENLALHLNGAVSRTREKEVGRFGSLIAEGPERWDVRPVVEVSLEREGDETTSRGMLLGAIWQTRSGVALDFAIRTGYADERETQFRSGITWNRHVAGPRMRKR